MKKFLNKNLEKFYSLIMYSLISLSIAGIAKSTILLDKNLISSEVNLWALSELLINYEGGFVRRGLIGQLIFFLDSDGILFDTALKLTFINFIIFILLVQLNLNFSNLSNLNKLLFHLSIFSVLDMTLYGGFFPRKEIYLINFYLILLLISRRFQNFNVFIFSSYLFITLALLIHEGIGFFIYFPFSIYLLKKNKINQINIKIYILYTVLLFLLTVIFMGDRDIVIKILDSLSSFDRTLIYNGVSESAIDTINWGLYEALRLFYIVFFSGSIVMWLFFLVFIPFTIQVVANLKLIEIVNQMKELLISNKEFLLIVPIFFLGWDWGRWIFILFYFSFFTLIKENVFKKNRVSNFSLISFYIFISLITVLPECCINVESTAVSSNFYRIFKSVTLTIQDIFISF